MSTLLLGPMSKGWAQEPPRPPVAERKDWQSHCSATIPISSALMGIMALDWQCSEIFNWGVRGGAVGFGYQKWLPFVTAEVGFLFPSALEAGTPETLPSQHSGSTPRVAPSWQLRGRLRYAVLQDSAFQGLTDLTLKGSFYSPSVQQWSLLTDADVSLEFSSRCASENSRIRTCALKLWQTLPPLWRTLGALQQTRNLDAYGVTFLVYFGAGAWTGSAGVGRTTTLVDRISASFFYPTLAVSYALQSSSTSQQKTRDP